MNEATQQEEPDERAVNPADVWAQLSPDVRARVVSLLAEMAYKYALNQNKSVSGERAIGVDDDASPPVPEDRAD